MVLRIVRLLFAAWLAGLSIGLTACFSDGSEATSTPTAFTSRRQVPAATRTPVQTRTPLPRPTATATPEALTLADVPAPQWRPVDAASLTPLDKEFGTWFLLDAETEELFSLLPQQVASLPTDRVTVSLLAWSPSGRMLIAVSRQRGPQILGSLYLGSPGQQPVAIDRRVPDSAAFSPDGALVVFTYDNEVKVLDAISFDEVAAFGLTDGISANWSHDSSYLAVSTRAVPHRERSITLWRRSDGQSMTVPGSGPLWSTTGHRLAFWKSDLDFKNFSSWIYDPDSGVELLYATGHLPAAWSPGDRYLALTKLDGQYQSFSVYGLSDGKRTTTVTGAGFLGWLDEGSAYFVANVCSSFDLSYIRADGSRLAPFPHGSPYVLSAYRSPGGNLLAYRAIRGSGTAITIYDLHSGASRDIPNPANLGLWESDAKRGRWSPDGRFLLVDGFWGGDGPCYPVPTPQTTTIERP